MSRRSNIFNNFVISSVLLPSQCNIYRVAIFRASCPFVGHDLTRSRSLKHPRPEACPRPQPGRACLTRTGQPWSHGQGRKRQVCSIFGFTRENSKCSRHRPRRALRQALNPNILISHIPRPGLWPSCILAIGDFQ